MDENLLPHDMDEVLNSSKSNHNHFKSSSNYKYDMNAPAADRPIYASASDKPIYAPASDKPIYTPPDKPIYASYNKPAPYQSSNKEEIVEKNTNIKKKNIFVKISNNISNRPKCYLVLIIVLIIIIIILFIYYKGLLFIGPYCPNNIKSNAYKNKMKNKNDNNLDQKNTSLKDSLRT